MRVGLALNARASVLAQRSSSLVVGACQHCVVNLLLFSSIERDCFCCAVVEFLFGFVAVDFVAGGGLVGQEDGILKTARTYASVKVSLEDYQEFTVPRKKRVPETLFCA